MTVAPYNRKSKHHHPPLSQDPYLVRNSRIHTPQKMADQVIDVDQREYIDVDEVERVYIDVDKALRHQSDQSQMPVVRAAEMELEVAGHN